MVVIFFQSKGKYSNVGNKENTKATIMHNFSSVFNTVVALKEGSALGYPQYFKNYDADDYIAGNFLHEAGHSLVGKKASKSNAHLCECESEALNLIEYYVQNGNNNNLHLARSNPLAIVLTSDNPEYYMDTLNYAVKNLSEHCDLLKLNMRQKVRLAGELAKEYALPSKVLDSIVNVYTPLAEKYDETKGADPSNIELCMELMIKNSWNHDAYRAGKALLEYPIVKQDLGMLLSMGTGNVRIKYSSMMNFEKTSGIELNPATAVDNKSTNPKTFIERMEEMFQILKEEHKKPLVMGM